LSSASGEAGIASLSLTFDIWIRFFEFCIWVTLFPGSKIPVRRSGIDYNISIPGEIQEYLIRRLYVSYDVSTPGERPPTFYEQAMTRRNKISWFSKLEGPGRR
jgi:hypothetical protein